MKKTIILTVVGTDFSFNVTTTEYNGYMNEIMPDNKVAPAHNLLIRTVDAKQKDELKKLLDETPGATLQMAGMINQEFAPAIEISVKK
jgi:hypothetical protein